MVQVIWGTVRKMISRAFFLATLLLIIGGLYFKGMAAFNLVGDYYMRGYWKGSIYKNYSLVIPDVGGLFLCNNRYLIGWQTSKSNQTFVLDTKTNVVVSHPDDFNQYEPEYGCRYPPMDEEVNFQSLLKSEKVRNFPEIEE